MPKPIADMIYRLTRIHEGDFAEDLPMEDRQLMLQDIKDLLSAYQPDDDELITDEWYEETLGDLFHEFDAEFMLCKAWSVFLQAEANTRGSSVYTLPLPHIKTRGDLRRLMKALNIKPKRG